jgi:hypothetical protein
MMNKKLITFLLLTFSSTAVFAKMPFLLNRVAEKTLEYAHDHLPGMSAMTFTPYWDHPSTMPRYWSPPLGIDVDEFIDNLAHRQRLADYLGITSNALASPSSALDAIADRQARFDNSLSALTSLGTPVYTDLATTLSDLSSSLNIEDDFMTIAANLHFSAFDKLCEVSSIECAGSANIDVTKGFALLVLLAQDGQELCGYKAAYDSTSKKIKDSVPENLRECLSNASVIFTLAFVVEDGVAKSRGNYIEASNLLQQSEAKSLNVETTKHFNKITISMEKTFTLSFANYTSKAAYAYSGIPISDLNPHILAIIGAGEGGIDYSVEVDRDDFLSWSYDEVGAGAWYGYYIELYNHMVDVLMVRADMTVPFAQVTTGEISTADLYNWEPVAEDLITTIWY